MITPVDGQAAGHGQTTGVEDPCRPMATDGEHAGTIAPPEVPVPVQPG